MLIALAASANLDPKAARALEALAHLQGCQAHCSVILSPADEGTYRKLGIQLTCEPKYQTNSSITDKRKRRPREKDLPGALVLFEKKNGTNYLPETVLICADLWLSRLL